MIKCRAGGIRAPVRRPRAPRRRGRRAVAARAVEEDEEMDDAVAQFLKAQDMSERGLDERVDVTQVRLGV